MSRSRKERRAPSIRLEMTADELRCLIAISEHYQRSMGPMRHLVRFTSSREVRGRFRFLDDESAILRSFAEAMLGEAETEGPGGAWVQFTLRAIVAFWGRLLASTQSPRSRRRLSRDEIARREALAVRLENAIRELYLQDAALVEGELETRRPLEQTWMRERLALPPEAASPHLE